MTFGKMGLAMVWIWTIMALQFAVSAAASSVHKVGDSDGWTTHVDYAEWASSNDFHVGDSLLFSYNDDKHNVLQVNEEQYESCDSSSPASSYNSGEDSIILKRPGTFYFLCGIGRHCEKGQKVEVKVTAGSSSNLLRGPTSSPTPIPNGPGPVGTPTVYSHRLKRT